MVLAILLTLGFTVLIHCGMVLVVGLSTLLLEQPSMVSQSAAYDENVAIEMYVLRLQPSYSTTMNKRRYRVQCRHSGSKCIPRGGLGGV